MPPTPPPVKVPTASPIGAPVPPPPMAEPIPVAVAVPEPAGPGSPPAPVPAGKARAVRGEGGRFASQLPQGGLPESSQPAYRDPRTGQMLSNQEVQRRIEIRNRVETPRAIGPIPAPVAQTVQIPSAQPLPPEPAAPSGFDIGRALYGAFSLGKTVGGVALVLKGTPPDPLPIGGDLPFALSILGGSFKLYGPAGPPVATALIVGRAIYEDVKSSDPIFHPPDPQILRVIERLALAESRMIRVEEATDP